jgi:hypothetical protein
MHMQDRPIVVMAALAATLLVSGCAVTRSEVKLGAGPAVAATAVASGKSVAIGKVVDARRFEASPREPSTPSLGSEGGGDATRARAIGRKRNTYGMALGDVLLEPGQTVAGVVREHFVVALRDAGYRVVDAGTGGVPVIDVDIQQFWSWVTPGFFAITVSTLVATDVTVAGRATPVSVRVTNQESALAVTDGTWTEAIDKAMAKWRADVVARRSELP